MSIEELEQRLLLEVDTAKARGLTLVSGSFGNPELQSCCLLTAGADIITESPGYDACSRLGLTSQQVSAIIQGFDADHTNFEGSLLGARLTEDASDPGVPYTAEEKPYYFLGWRLRQMLKPIDHHDLKPV